MRFLRFCLLPVRGSGLLSRRTVHSLFDMLTPFWGGGFWCAVQGCHPGVLSSGIVW